MANKAVFCIVKAEAQASRIVDDLKSAGFSNNDVSALFPERGLSLATLSAVSRTPGMGGFLIYPLIYPNPRNSVTPDEPS